MRCVTTTSLVKTLNPKIEGWANHVKYYVAKDTYSYVDSHIFKIVWGCAKRRHPKMSKSWGSEARSWYFLASLHRNG
ncbi:MAG: group II intron maturase-specific domain-containing protein [Chlamydiales bacterium]